MYKITCLHFSKSHSIYSFGSKLRSKELGFIYNNELADFSEFWQRVYNLTSDKKVPGKRPMSKASPTVFLDKHGDVVGVFGAAGGFFIPTALIQVCLSFIFSVQIFHQIVNLHNKIHGGLTCDNSLEILLLN